MKRKLTHKRQAYRGPLFKKTDRVSQKKFSFGLKKIFSLGTIAILVLALVYILFYSNVFRILNISVQGNEYLSENTIQQTTQAQMQKKRFYIFSQSNIFWLNKNSLREELEKSLALEEFYLSRKLPARIELSIKEEIPSLRWQTPKGEFYLNKKGVVAQRVFYNTLQFNIPVVATTTDQGLRVGERIVQGEMVEDINKLDALFKENLPQAQISHYWIPNLLGDEFHVFLTQGTELYLTTAGEGVVLAFDNFRKLLTDQKINLEETTYVDLRISNKVFYK
jgi:cell division septal protein FtsQ